MKIWKREKLMTHKNKAVTPRSAMLFVLIVGFLWFVTAIARSGFMSVFGVYLDFTGASASAIGFISGLGVFIIISLQSFFSFLVAKTGCYWLFSILGISIELLCIPALGFIPVNGWKIAMLLFFFHRLSHGLGYAGINSVFGSATRIIGPRKSRSILEFFQHAGNILGPIILFFIMQINSSEDGFYSYKSAIITLIIPVFIAVCLLIFMKIKFSNNYCRSPEFGRAAPILKTKKTFLFLYMIGICAFALGFADYTIISMHVVKNGLFGKPIIPLIYAFVMLIDLISSTVFRLLFDNYGIKSIFASSLISALFVIPIFLSDNFIIVLLGIAIWAIGMGSQEYLMNFMIARVVSKADRGVWFNRFRIVFGMSWFLGSSILGILYDQKLILFAYFALATQIVASAFFFAAAIFSDKKRIRQ